MRGSITRRGKASWRLKFEAGRDASGKRQTRYITVRGKRADAERELTRLLGDTDRGMFVEPSKTTVAQWLRDWLGGPSDPQPHGLARKTTERYRQLAEQQVIPHLGANTLQKLRPAHVAAWHKRLLESGGKNGRPLSARTCGHAHRVLHRALARAVHQEVLSRNVAAAVPPPKVDASEVEILDASQIAEVLAKLRGHALHAIATAALATGMRRGELLALRLASVDLETGIVKVERSLEETAEGLAFKAPKTAHGRRSISLPPNAVQALREHRRQVLETRMALGLGRPDPDTLLFGMHDGSPMRPDQLSWLWRSACKSLKLPRVSFHALRHTHASALIAAGLDVVIVSRRLGHASPTTTLRVYAHLFQKDDSAAAGAIEAAMRQNNRDGL
ncbi:MAG: site-specific integrase [Hyphomicrobiales bacterium]|nr:MAG: site-specific integrase [Hyphomicrobiales bacterium]